MPALSTFTDSRRLLYGARKAATSPRGSGRPHACSATIAPGESRMTATVSSSPGPATSMPACNAPLYLGPATAYAICLSFFVATSIAVGALRTDSQPQPHDPAVGSLRRVTAGIRFIRSKPILLGAISLDLFAVLLGVPPRCCRSMRGTSCGLDRVG